MPGVVDEHFVELVFGEFARESLPRSVISDARLETVSAVTTAGTTTARNNNAASTSTKVKTPPLNDGGGVHWRNLLVDLVAVAVRGLREADRGMGTASVMRNAGTLAGSSVPSGANSATLKPCPCTGEATPPSGGSNAGPRR